MTDKIRKWLKHLKNKLNPRRRSGLFRRSLRNASFSSTEYIFLQILMFIATPFFVSRLGVDKYGIWMLVNSVMGFMGLMSFGLSDATIKYVSAHLANKNIDGVVRVVRSTLTMYGLLGLFTAAVAYFLAPILVNHVFNVQLENTRLAIAAIQIASFGMMARLLDSVFLSTLQGYQRYDLAAKITIIVNTITLAVNVGLVLLGYGVIQILLATIGIIVLGGMTKAIVAKRFLLPSLVFLPIFDRKALKEIFSFGLYSWLQSVGGILLSQADRLIIASLLNTSALTHYTVCLQLAQQVSAVLAKAVLFLFPLSSAAREEGNLAHMRTIYFKGINLVTISCVGLGLPIFLFSHNILSFWMGVEFANETANVLRVLTFAFALMATSIVPYHFMNGTGFVRLNTLFAFISGFVVTFATIFMIPWLGILGAAWARCFNTPTSVIARTVVHHKVLDDRRWYAGLSIFAPVIFTFMIAFIILKTANEPALNLFCMLPLLAITSMIGMLLASVLCWLFNSQRVFATT